MLLSLLSLHETVDDYSCLRVPLSTQPVHLALSADDLILSVCSMTSDGLLVALFDVRTLVHKVGALSQSFRVLRGPCTRD